MFRPEPPLTRRRLLGGLLATGGSFVLLRRAAWAAAAPPSSAPGPASGGSKIAVADKVAAQARPFPLADVRLLPGPFKDNQDRNSKYLLALEPDRLLARFRETAGLPPKGAVYGGWESQGISGHSLGHYLTACALMYAATGDARFKQRVDYMVDELQACQDALGTGYVGGIPGGKEFFDGLAEGRFRVTGRHNFANAWVPWYTMHKLYAGLLDAYWLCDNAKARQVLVRLCDWACALSDRLTDAQFQDMLRVEFGGMNEALADAYAVTGDEKYLRLAERFNHRAVTDPLMRGEDNLNNLHANTQIPKLLGLAREYELTGEPRYRAGAEFFWENVTTKRSYAIGGNSDREVFAPLGTLGRHLSAETCETCNTYNMLKLTRHLFAWQPQARYFDFYERALYNHILASQDPATGMFTYFVSLRPGHFKTFSTPEDSFWCCVGSGMENHAKYGESIYFHGDGGLFVNLYLPSELTWTDQGLTLRQETNFPEDFSSKLTFQLAAPLPLALRLRHPWWALGAPVTVRVNGEVAATSDQPSSYITVERTWRDGDRVEISGPMPARFEPLADDPAKVAVLRGPLVLAGLMGKDGMTAEMPYAAEQLKYVRLAPPLPAPALAAPATGVPPLRPVAGKPLAFTLPVAGGEMTLAPLFQVHDQRYTVYWNVPPAEPAGAPSGQTSP